MRGVTGFGVGFLLGGGGSVNTSGGGGGGSITSSSNSTSKYLSCFLGKGSLLDYRRIYLKMRNAYHKN